MTENYKTSSKKRLQGVIVSDKMHKTRVVEVERLVRHPLYNKVLRKRKKFYAHDEEGKAKTGDFVVLEETRPISKLKRWRIVEIKKK